MKKYLLVFIILFNAFSVFAQGENSDQFPVFANCQNTLGKELENCFYGQLQNLVFQNFNVPATLNEKGFKGKVLVIFEVDASGNFKVLYVDAIYPELIEESKRVFSLLPKVTPAMQNGKPVYSKYNLSIAIPLVNPTLSPEVVAENARVSELKTQKSKTLTELDSIKYKKFDFPIYQSHLNVAFSHSYYAQFDAEMNQMGSNNHTGSKPFTYSEVAKYHDFNKEYNSIRMNKTSWVGRKLFDENLVQLKGEDYWLTINPVFDLRLGKGNPSASKYTYINTRGIQVQGGVSKEITFTSTIYESQARFADYYNQYARSLAPAGGNPAIIPGIGVGKEFKNNAFDFPSADAHLTYIPSKYFNFELGYGRNFIGDGYRSLILGDGSSPYPFFKINTTFWKIKYTNLNMWLKDVRPEVTTEQTYGSKYMSNHYLSWNVNNRLNLGFFESVVWANTNGRGFDANFVNPIVFFQTVEFQSSGRSSNSLVAMTGKYKWNNSVNLYGQLLLDEFSLSDMTGGNKSWKNKYGCQFGIKYFNAFNVKNLLLQGEFNAVRPYVYSHSNVITNYGNYNQSMGHPWGSNFREFVAIARYHKGRYFADAKITYGVRGFDFDTTTDSKNYGSNIYLSYNDNRAADTGVKIGQGNTTTIWIADIQGGYLINPTTNLKLFGSLIYRNFNTLVNTATVFKEDTVWLSLGLRADLLNWYFDY